MKSPANPRQTLVPRDILDRPGGKILFITHLAIGDFVYLQNCFAAFSRQYPHLRVDLWVDELRRSDDPDKWPALKKYSLYDWLDDCPYFGKIHKETYSTGLLGKSTAAARAENYDIVAYLTTLRSRPPGYARLARSIAPRGFVAGIKSPFRLLKPHLGIAYKNLDATIPLYRRPKTNPPHISNVYAGWFKTLFDIDIPPAARLPFINVPGRWRQEAGERLASWGADGGRRPIVLINIVAKSPQRSWTLENAAALMRAMRQTARWGACIFIINTMPEELPATQAFAESCGIADVHAYSAVDNFFQLPAMLARCDLAISVETAVMHLANAVRVPVVALMRQQNPDWAPLDSSISTVVTTRRRYEWIKDIAPGQVMLALERL